MSEPATYRDALYLRVSTDEQRERQTVETQRQTVTRHLSAQGIQPVECYVDDGVSGTVPLEARPEGARLLRDARAGRVTRVWVYRADRLARDAAVGLVAVDLLRAAGVRFESVSERIDTDTPSGRLHLVMLFGFAGFERDSTVERSRLGTERLVREGVWFACHLPPYGYSFAETPGRRGQGRLVPDETPVPGHDLTRADVARLVFRLCADEGLSLRRIALLLNARGIPTYHAAGTQISNSTKRPNSGLWHEGQIYRLLKSSTYRGVDMWGEESPQPRELIARECAALVDTELWERAQATLMRNRLMATRNVKHRYLLRGLIKCGACGLSYIGYGHRATYFYYGCGGRLKNAGPKLGRCPSKPISNNIEQAVWADIEEFLRRPGELLARLTETSRDAPDAAALSNDLRRVEALIAGQQREQDRVVSLYRRGLIDDESLARQLAEVRREGEGLAQERERVRTAMQGAADAGRRVSAVADLLAEMAEELDTGPEWETRLRFVRALVEKIVVTMETGEDGKERPVALVSYRFPIIPIPGCDTEGSPSIPQPGKAPPVTLERALVAHQARRSTGTVWRRRD